MKKPEIDRADSIDEVKEENRILKQRLIGFERIVNSLSLEIDRRGKIIEMLQSAAKTRNVFQNRKIA